jgi:alpha/beta superfamily hydrolase
MSEETLRKSAASTAKHKSTPLPMPALSIYTTNNTMVTWQASLDPQQGQTKHLEVNSCHVGLGLNPTVWLTIAQRLSGV